MVAHRLNLWDQEYIIMSVMIHGSPQAESMGIKHDGHIHRYRTHIFNSVIHKTKWIEIKIEINFFVAYHALSISAWKRCKLA